jgi:hypothetical protein
LSTTDKRFALIIANYQYEDTNLQKLEAPAYDAKALESVLKNPDLAGFEVTPLVNESAQTIRREIARLFAKKGRDDLLLLYFSGHGVVDKRGRLYLAVKDTNLDIISGTSIEATFITNEMNASDSRRQLLILDCCNSGAFERGMKGAPGASVHTCDIFEGIGVGRFVMTATDSTQYAWEGDNLIGKPKNSIFTRYLIKGLQGEAADDNGEITFDSLYEYVHDQVVSETPKQTPCKWTYKQEGKLVIARAQPKQKELPSDLVEKIKNIDARVRLIAVSDLDHLLHGSHKGLALAAYYALEHLSKDDSHAVSEAAVRSLAVCPLDIKTLVTGGAEIKEKINELNISAQHLFDEGEYNEAIDKWSEVLKLDPENKIAVKGIDKVIKKFCPVCSTQNVRRKKFCRQCGARLIKT